MLPLVELAGKRMGIVGFGRIGRRVGELAHALGMQVLAYDVCPGSPPDYGLFAWRSIEAIFAEADVISLHCPLDEQSQGMVNRARIGTMKRSSLLINTARGGLVDEQDLADALNEGRIAGASGGCLVTRAARQGRSIACCEKLPDHSSPSLGDARGAAAADGDHGGERRCVPAGQAINVVN